MDGDSMVTLIIPCRGQDEMTRKCIQSIYDHVSYPLHLLVVDNGGTFEMKGVTILKGKPNWGFAHSCNMAAEKTDGDLLFLNNDTLALNDFVTPMVVLAGHPIGIVGALLLYSNHRVQHFGASYNKGNPNHPDKGKSLTHLSNGLHDKEVEGVTFACAYVVRDCWEQLNGLDEETFPFGYEDIDFCLRAKHFGWKSFVTPGARLIHLEHKTQYKYLKDVRPKSDVSIRNLRKRWG